MLQILTWVLRICLLTTICCFLNPPDICQSSLQHDTDGTFCFRSIRTYISAAHNVYGLTTEKFKNFFGLIMCF